jgi:hypothetical protein
MEDRKRVGKEKDRQFRKGIRKDSFLMFDEGGSLNEVLPVSSG